MVLAADWDRLRHAFLDGRIFWDQFPEVVTRAGCHTVIFTALAFVLALAAAMLLALMRLSPLRPYRWFAATYIEVFRGLPALLTLLAIGYALPIALDVRVPGTYGRGAVAPRRRLRRLHGRDDPGGHRGRPAGQVEAARSLGMSAPRATASIVLPQAMRIVVPPMTNELVALVKDTSLLGIVLGSTPATSSSLKFSRDSVGRTFNITPIVAAGLVYLAITIPLTRLVALLERRNRRAR